jgi:ribonuclease HI
MDYVNVYIDGSCVNNGKDDAKAGYGVYFGENDERNDYGRVLGKQSNNTGELNAIIRAIEILNDENRIINIYTDSEYVIKCAGSYSKKLEKNNWITSTGKVPPNIELLKKLHSLITNKKNIKIFHIKAHTNLQDEHSIGNYNADKLANLAIGVENKKDYKDKKTYINISYEYKDEVKKHGAKWDLNEKKWYYDENISDENKRAINIIELSVVNTKELVPIIEEADKIYISIPYKNKDAAKKLGARWEPEKKSWFYYSNNKNAKALKALEA